MDDKYPAGGNHVIGVNVQYEYDNERPRGPVWLRFSTPARAEEFAEFMNLRVWYGRTIYAQVTDEEMHLGRERELEKGRPRYFRDVWYMPPPRMSRRREEQ